MTKKSGRSLAPVIPRLVVPSSKPVDMSPGRVRREFMRRLEDGAKLEVPGQLRKRPERLLDLGYAPQYRIDLFDVSYYLTRVRQNEDIRFFVAYVALPRDGRTIHARLFYKDLSLVWRSASHFARSQNENWVGKGDVRTEFIDGDECITSDEVTTDLPLEIQTAIEELLHRTRRIRYDDDAIFYVLRRGADHRVEPFRDFSGPRARAASNPRNLIHGGRSIARFTRKNDPTSLRFARGFEPDFAKGVVEIGHSRSRLYGGNLARYRIVSSNRQVQYLFNAGPRQVWIGSCQPTTTEIMSYGVRTVDAIVDDDVLLPGYEYHFMQDGEDGPELYSQIPPGFAGEQSAIDDFRADASPFLEKMPVIREFRRKLLRKHRG